MSGTSEIYGTCASFFPDPASDLSGLLKCISDSNEALVRNLQDEAVSAVMDKAIAAATEAAGTSSLDPNVGYVLLSGTLVFFMQCGFAMLCAGSIRAKNVKNVILWNLLDSAGGGLAFWAVGWAFIYGSDGADDQSLNFLGNAQFFPTTGRGIGMHNFFFQFTFACALSSIVAGTIAERTRMKAYLLYSTFLVAFVYPVCAHALWSTRGFLSITAQDKLFGSGAIDLAGSGAVHMCGGVTALAGALILGPRLGRFHDEDGNPLDEPKEFPAHNVALSFLGTFCLWYGWYGFNSGSAFATPTADPFTVASLTIVNTTLAACAGAISALFTSSFFDWRYTGIPTYDCAYTMNGCLTGLVAVTAGCGTVEPWAAVVIGIVAGWVYLGGSKLLIKFCIDDAVDAIPVHLVGGAWGMIATGLFSSPDLLALTYPGSENNAGWFYEWHRGSANFSLLGAQLVAVVFIAAFAFVVMGVYFWVLNFMGWFRIDPLEEEVGMDASRHKGAAYDMTGATNETMQQFLQVRSESLHGKNKNIEEKLKELKEANEKDTKEKEEECSA